MAKKINIKELFSSNLVRLRKEAGLNQVSLAVKSGLTYNFINDMEKSKKGFSAETIGKLSEALNVEPMQFFINPEKWGSAEKQKYVAILDNLNDNINRMFANYRDIKLKVK